MNNSKPHGELYCSYIPWLHWGTLGHCSKGAAMAYFRFSERTQIHFSDFTHRSTKLFGPNYLINKSVRFERFVEFILFVLGGVVCFGVLFVLFWLRDTMNILLKSKGTVNQERNLWPRVAILESGVELASPQLCWLHSNVWVHKWKVELLWRKQGIDVMEAATMST